MVQFGINGNPDVTAAWEKTVLKDDPKTMQSNTRGFVTYGNTGRPNSRGTQIFINYKDNSFLDAQGFVPFGKVVEGMEVVDMLSDEYGTSRRTRRAGFQRRATSFSWRTSRSWTTSRPPRSKNELWHLFTWLSGHLVIDRVIEGQWRK